MTDAELWGLLLLFLRFAASLVSFSPLAAATVPTQVKIGLAVALALVWVPVSVAAAPLAIGAALSSPHSGWHLGWWALCETVLGLAIGWGLSLALVPLRIAGAYLGQELGLTLGGLASPIDQRPADIVAQLLEALGLLACLALNLHHLALLALRRTLTLFPVTAPLMLPQPGWVIGWVTRAEQTGLSLAAPIGVGLFLTLIVTLLMTRAAPQLNQLSFGTSFRLLLGLGLLILWLPELLTRFTSSIAQWPAL